MSNQEVLLPPVFFARIRFSSMLKSAFTRIYSYCIWGKENTSGVGSMPENARPYLKMLQRLLNETQYTTVVDYGCGIGNL
jgi:hypothetical protein